ncbi:MAG TPA: LEA type 2 family protein [Puia sp.]|jgi:LEA14-like dessication related protein|nr:LEA type 2 family protein [Puia sp.]
MRQLLSVRSALTGICLMVWIAACRQPEPVEYFGFTDLQVGQVVAGKTNLSAIVKLYNPNTYKVALERAEVDIAINGQHSGHSLLDSTIRIPAKDTFYVPVTLQLDLKGLFSNALQMLMGKREATLTVDGRVKIKKGMFTFNRSIHYEGKQDLSSLMPSGSGF